MTVRALVVDDEAVARRRILRLLAERDDVTCVGECSGGRVALETIPSTRPDLLFLDVQMPDLDGFQVLDQLPRETLPAVIFVTAYDRYALQAFEACAVDYLLKPYTGARFNRAVDRALRWIALGPGAVDEDRLKRLLREVLRSERREAGSTAAVANRVERFMVKRRGRSEFIPAASVDWIEADGNYLRLHVAGSNHLVRGTISGSILRLDPKKFVRVHRRYIVNIERVKEVQPWFGGDYVILLTDGHKLRLSRGFRDHFRSRMIGG